MTTKSSRVMHMAHIMHQDKPRFPWSELVRRAWYFIHFREWLKNGICTFSFYKSDGSIREAKGTLNELLIPEDKKPGASSRQTGGAASAEKGNKTYTLAIPLLYPCATEGLTTLYILTTIY